MEGIKLKKTVKLFLVALCMLTLLTGCYQSDATFKVTSTGKVNVEISMLTNDEGASMFFGSSYDEAAPEIIEQFTGAINEEAKEAVEEISEKIDDVEYKGIKYTGKYDSLEDMYASQLYTAAMNFSAVPVYVNELSLNGTAVGIAFNETKGIFGSTFSGKGAIDYNLFKDMIGVNGDGVAVSNLTFKFPVGAYTFSKGNKNFFMPTFKYTAKSDAETVDVDFKVFIPNYFMLLFVIIFILLIVAVVLLVLKVKKLQRIIDGDDEEEIETEGEVFISEDDENLFEGNEEKVEFAEEVKEEVAEEPTEEEPTEEE